jgi:3-dehydroquinate synthase
MSDRSELPARIVLTGFSGTGKSAVAPYIARELGWEVIDTDPLIEERAGKRILDIFTEQGEERFRQLEIETIREVCSRRNVVVSTGGGAVLRPVNRRAMAQGGFIVCLEARPETIFSRLRGRAGSEPLDRPLLATENPLDRIRDLKANRQHLYALCDWTVHTDQMTPEQVAVEVIRAYQELGPAVLADETRVEALTVEAAQTPTGTLHAVPEGASVMVHTGSGDYPVFVGWGVLRDLGRRLREMGLSRQVYLISDEAVYHHHGVDAEKTLRESEIEFDSYVIPPGEGSKTLATASGVYDWLIERRAERGHTIVALGGGVVTDLAGFAAATFARGLPLVHVPTTVLGMVDAAIGGKVAVNHSRAKNMVGAFYQPRMVLADVATLRTLPPREFYSGWAEAIKHAFIADEAYLRFFEENAELIQKLNADAVIEAVRRSVAIKAEIVAEDEKEETGRRTVLNYGHTLAHAIESTTGYVRFRHGEADGIGMMAEGYMSVRLGMLPVEVLERQRAILERFRLPTHAEGLDRGAIEAAMALDKKVVGRKMRWVLLEAIGRPVIRDDVPPEVVTEALDSVLK